MSLFSDIGGFLGQVQQASEEFATVKQEIFTVAKDTVLQVETQTSEVASEIKNDVTAVGQTAKDTATEAKSQLTNQ